MAEFGTLGFKDFDRGVVITLGSELVDLEIDGDIRQAYAIDCPGLLEYPDGDNLPEELRPLPAFPDGMVPVFFVFPEEVFQPYILPCIVVRRGDMTPNFDRAPWFGYQNKPAADAVTKAVKINGAWVTGPSKTVTREHAVPFDIGYEVQSYARLQNDEVRLLTCILKKMRPPWFSVVVFDSEDCRGVFDAGPVAVSDVSELAEVADRTIGHSVSFDVRADIHLDDPVVNDGQDGRPAVITGLPEITYKPFFPPPVVPPDC